MSSFNGTPFNDEQLDHIRSIAKLPPEQVSWCGWGRVGPHCCASPSDECKAGKTLADKMRVWCPECHNVPRGDGVITHRIGCRHSGATP